MVQTLIQQALDLKSVKKLVEERFPYLLKEDEEEDNG